MPQYFFKCIYLESTLDMMAPVRANLNSPTKSYKLQAHMKSSSMGQIPLTPNRYRARSFSALIASPRSRRGDFAAGRIRSMSELSIASSDETLSESGSQTRILSPRSVKERQRWERHFRNRDIKNFVARVLEEDDPELTQQQEVEINPIVEETPQVPDEYSEPLEVAETSLRVEMVEASSAAVVQPRPRPRRLWFRCLVPLFRKCADPPTEPEGSGVVESSDGSTVRSIVSTVDSMDGPLNGQSADGGAKLSATNSEGGEEERSIEATGESEVRGGAMRQMTLLDEEVEELNTTTTIGTGSSDGAPSPRGGGVDDEVAGGAVACGDQAGVLMGDGGVRETQHTAVRYVGEAGHDVVPEALAATGLSPRPSPSPSSVNAASSSLSQRRLQLAMKPPPTARERDLAKVERKRAVRKTRSMRNNEVGMGKREAGWM